MRPESNNSLYPGYFRSLPGFGRYAVLGSDESGVFNLQISNASLGDEAVYECQVSDDDDDDDDYSEDDDDDHDDVARSALTAPTSPSAPAPS